MDSDGSSDGNIRYYEYENDKFEYLSEYKSPDPQRGVAFLPKRGLDLRENEVMRALKTVNDSYIEPISFIVPRKSEVFQEDIYPPVTGTTPAMSSGEWFGGKEALPSKIDLESVYSGEKPKEVPSDYKPSTPLPTPVPATARKELPVSQTSPAKSPGVPKSPPPTMKEQADAISNMTSKYADAPEDPSPEDSSFDEIPTPAERNVRTALQHDKNDLEPAAKASPGVGTQSQSAPTVEEPAETEASKIETSKVWIRILNHLFLR